MVVIRLARAGTKNKPFFHIVAAESRGPRDGKYLARLGLYDPKTKENAKKITLDKVAYASWVKKGAQMSDTVRSLMKKKTG